ncbi:hypothetical protein IA57_07650 [Mangrovimonas yunxiaonensis]|uniref:Outer membrane protein beta-barrel domain-containing protein n=1 Tax=Mangrovimonas yunxiaonensis TaxID=1197477 RepID=A0A084TI17_9FLAO|nr:hypothetical protein [Mangrovimonas yunxiaonensis]KFB00353.1 hypothetical protein IA57_07650 [Mangrovimonas yunxiaonensis]GGH35271.1 hypothetical protein GCM10011364_01680 [Mangrovimonas yunxiaonensis]
MRYFCLTIALIFSLSSFAQHQASEWSFSFGANLINNLGLRSPYNSPDEWAFKHPISFSANKLISDSFSADVALSLNGFNSGKTVDGFELPEDETYFATDLHANYHIGRDLLWDHRSWLDVYVSAGPGLFIVKETNLSLNAGVGAVAWLNSAHSFGIKVQSVAKFALGQEPVDSNHFQHHLQFVFCL